MDILYQNNAFWVQLRTCLKGKQFPLNGDMFRSSAETASASFGRHIEAIREIIELS